MSAPAPARVATTLSAALLAGCVLTVALYLATIRVAANFGLKL